MKRLELFRRLMTAVLLALLLALAGCSGGSDGAPGAPGAAGATGATGAPGAAGPAGGAARVAEKHGEAVAMVEELEGALPATVAITGATADAAGVAKVTFTVKDAAGTAVTGKGAVANAASFAIASLQPKGGGISYNKWVPYIWRAASNVNQAYRERNTASNLIEGPAGTYTYTFVQNLSTATMPAGATPITYDRTRTHRVMVAMRGSSSGYVGGTTFDFVPAGGAFTTTREIVDDATCRKCHSNTPGHYGPWNGIVKACVMCHTAGNALVNSAANGGATNSLEASVMIHKIHAGNELRTVMGPDGKYYKNPWTTVDETADNGPAYQLGSTKFTAAFPAVLANCQACHTGSGANVDNWKTVPSRAACGSCHDNINWTTGANHSTNRAMANDDTCTICHFDTGVSFGKSVANAHQWTTKDIRNIPEFDITLTTDTPARGYYITGEKPVITIALKDHFTGAVIPGTSVIEDPAGEGCIPKPGAEGTECTVPRDGLFRAASIYVTGPRGQRVPNLLYTARAKVTTSGTGPWNLSGMSAAERALQVMVDSGEPMLAYNTEKVYEGFGADELISGSFTVTLPAASLSVADVVAALNANATFHERALAYADEANGRLSIRSRGIAAKNNKGQVIRAYPQRNIRIVSAPAGMFAAADIGSWKTAGSATQGRIRTNPANNDPKATFNAADIKYTLDQVDDLVPGTYVINVEYGDAGRGPTFNPPGVNQNPPEPPYVDYRTPSVAVATFNVKTNELAASQLGADGKEIPSAGNCTACHWSDAGVGFVLDPPRHNKLFNAQAVDQCGGCHDYQSAQNPLTTTAASFGGGHPISKRTHAVHNGSALNYPTITVAHEETSAFGRNWNIKYPMDIRNCESCHPASTTSGSWKSNPNRLACMGCHDSDAASAHMKIQTYDPTPLAPWSGDEKESCKSCH